MVLLIVSLAGGLGALARFLLDGLVRERLVRERLVPGRATTPFPWGTVVINVTGSFLLGVLAGLALWHGLDPDVRAVAGTGFCGGYTTFSAFGVETVRLAEDGRHRLALANMAGSTAAALLAAAAGLALASL